MNYSFKPEIPTKTIRPWKKILIGPFIIQFMRKLLVIKKIIKIKRFLIKNHGISLLRNNLFINAMKN
jgi:hypothetical protein